MKDLFLGDLWNPFRLASYHRRNQTECHRQQQNHPSTDEQQSVINTHRIAHPTPFVTENSKFEELAEEGSGKSGTTRVERHPQTGRKGFVFLGYEGKGLRGHRDSGSRLDHPESSC